MDCPLHCQYLPVIGAVEEAGVACMVRKMLSNINKV
jgi:hypothetical protein